jgi:hypothetical protein
VYWKLDFAFILRYIEAFVAASESILQQDGHGFQRLKGRMLQATLCPPSNLYIEVLSVLTQNVTIFEDRLFKR